MSLTDLASIGNFVSGVAIVASLIYAALQFRIYAKTAHETRLIAGTENIQQFTLAIASNADIARIYRDGLEDMDSLESLDQWRFGSLMQTLISYMTLAIEFDDIADPRLTEKSLYWILGRPGAGVWWKKARFMYNEKIQLVIDEAVKEGAARNRRVSG